MEIGCLGCLLASMLIGILSLIAAPLGIYLGITQRRARDRGWAYVRDGDGDLDDIGNCIRSLKTSKDPEDQNLVTRLIDLREDLIAQTDDDSDLEVATEAEAPVEVATEAEAPAERATPATEETQQSSIAKSRRSAEIGAIVAVGAALMLVVIIIATRNREVMDGGYGPVRKPASSAVPAPSRVPPAPTTTVPSRVPVTGRKEHVATRRYAFDIPALVGKSIDEVRAALRPFALADEQAEPTELETSVGFTEWDNTFKKDGEELLVTYNVANRRVVDFFLIARTQDRDLLLRTGNLNPSSPRYGLEYVENIEDRSQITGVKVIPNAP